MRVGWEREGRRKEGIEIKGRMINVWIGGIGKRGS